MLQSARSPAARSRVVTSFGLLSVGPREIPGRARKVLADHPSVSADELRQAETRLKDFVANVRASGRGNASGVFAWRTAVTLVVFIFAFAAVPSILLALLAVFVIGVVVAALRPSRGLQDRVARTFPRNLLSPLQHARHEDIRIQDDLRRVRQERRRPRLDR